MTKTQHHSKPIYIEAAKPLAEKMFPDLDIDEYPKNLSFNQSFVHEFANELGQVCQNKNNTLNSTEFVNSIIFEYKQLLKEKMSQAFIINFLKLNAQYLPKQSSIKIIAFKKSIINAIFSNYIKSLKSTCNLPTGELETLESSIHSYDAQITLINHLNREQLDQLIFCFQELFDYQLFQSSLSNLNGSIPNHIELLMTPFIKQSDLFKEL